MAAPASGSRIGENADEEQALVCLPEENTSFEGLDIDTATLVRAQSIRRPLIGSLIVDELPWSRANASCYLL